MIYLTGDTHGKFDRFTRKTINEMCKPNEENVFVILGDAGFNYYGDGRDTYNKIRMSERLPENAVIFCIHGNHEIRPKHLSNYKTKQWHTGTVYYEPEYPNILFARDGIFKIDGYKILVIGGAYSIDKEYRIRTGNKWFSDEQPSIRTKKYIESLIEKNDKFDYVFTHTCPVSCEPTEAFLPYVDQSKVDKTTEIWLESVKESIEYKRWYCGHYHIEKNTNKHTFLYQSFVALGKRYVDTNTVNMTHKQAAFYDIMKFYNTGFGFESKDETFYDNGDGTVTVEYYRNNKKHTKICPIKETDTHQKYIQHNIIIYLDEIDLVKPDKKDNVDFSINTVGK